MTSSSNVRNNGQHLDIFWPFWSFVRLKKFGSDIWLSTTYVNSHFIHTHVTKSFVLGVSTYVFVMC